MGLSRQCSKTGCSSPAVATLTYVYRDQAAVLGPLATYAEPHTYDLCARHAERLTAPRGWEVVRLGSDHQPVPRAGDADDLLALADAVREPARSRSNGESTSDDAARQVHRETATGAVEVGRRGHLRMLRDS